MKKKILILGTLYGQADAMEVLKSLGWTVYSCGYRREGPGVAVADEFFLVDILDVPGVTALAKKLEVDCVYCVGSDIAMLTVAAVSEKLGLLKFHSSAITETLHRKVLLRQFLQSNNLSCVEYRALKSSEDLESFKSYPAIIKPTDSQGQRGITKVYSLDEAKDSLPSALKSSPTGVAIIEEWLEGNEISVHVFVVNGEVQLFLPSDRFTVDCGFIGLPSGHRFPAKFMDTDNCTKVRQLVEDFVDKLGIENGPLYFQIILTPTGPRIVEVAPRLDGCHLWRLILERTGFNLMQATFECLLEGKWETPKMAEPETTHILHFHMSEPNCTFKSSDYPSSTTGRICFEQYQVEENSMTRDNGSPISRVGYFIEEIQ